MAANLQKWHLKVYFSTERWAGKYTNRRRTYRVVHESGSQMRLPRFAELLKINPNTLSEAVQVAFATRPDGEYRQEFYQVLFNVSRKQRRGIGSSKRPARCPHCNGSLRAPRPEDIKPREMTEEEVMQGLAHPEIAATLAGLVPIENTGESPNNAGESPGGE